MAFVIALVILLALAAFLTAPNMKRSRMARWRGQRFAHRGLHDAAQGVVENTLPAFDAACRADYGIELDIQFTADGEVVVFHDDDLRRLAGDRRMVRDVMLDELRGMPLSGVESARVPTLNEVLACVNGRVPLLIELKNGRRNADLCRALMEKLKYYPGEYIVESFNPLIVMWFRRHAPQVVRGQLVCGMKGYRETVRPVPAFCMAALLFNAFARPDFVAYDANDARFHTPRFQRTLYHTPLAAWTVRTLPQAKLAAERDEICIFEQIRP